MAIWNASNIVLTTIGAEILSKVQQGIGSITISKVRSGAGYVAPANLSAQTGVTTPAQDMSIVGSSADAGGSVLEIELRNDSLAQAYDLYQIGVYVTHPDYTGDQLYMIAQCDTSDPDHIPLPSDTVLIVSYSLFIQHSGVATISLTVSAASTVTLNSDQTLTGKKNFVTPPSVPTPVSVEDAANKGYVDGLDSQNVKTAGTQTIAGDKTLTGNISLPSTTSIGNVSADEIMRLDGVTSPLQAQLNAKAPLASPALTGTPTAPTAPSGTNTTQVASTAFVSLAIAAIMGTPALALNTIQKISAALNGDGNFNTTIRGLITAVADRVTEVENSLTNLLSAYVAKTGNQNIEGIKTFVSPPVVPTPVNGTDAANKDYVDGKLSKTTDDSVQGKVTFLNAPNVPTPTAAKNPVPKDYLETIANQGVKTTDSPSFVNLSASGTISANKVVGAVYQQ